MRRLSIIAISMFCTFAIANDQIKVLHIGDSHSSGIFGWELDRLIRTSPNTINATVGSCGAIGRYYFTGQKTKCGFYHNDSRGSDLHSPVSKTPLAEELLKDVFPDIAILQFGGNYMGYANEFIKKDIVKTAEFFTAQGIRCFWVGAPDSRIRRERRAEVKKIIQETIKDHCTFIDSTLFTKYPASGGDGIHYWGIQGGKIARQWAKKVYEFIFEFEQK